MWSDTVPQWQLGIITGYPGVFQADPDPDLTKTRTRTVTAG